MLVLALLQNRSSHRPGSGLDIRGRFSDLPASGSSVIHLWPEAQAPTVDESADD